MEIQKTLDKVKEITGVEYEVALDELKTIDVLVKAIEDLTKSYEYAVGKLADMNSKIQSEYEIRKETKEHE